MHYLQLSQFTHWTKMLTVFIFIPVQHFNTPPSPSLTCSVSSSPSCSLLPGRPYIFLVRSVNRIGPGPWSEPLEVVSGAGPPDTPHPPHLACRSPHSVHLVWEEPINNGAGIEQYSIQIAEVRMGVQLKEMCISLVIENYFTYYLLELVNV